MNWKLRYPAVSLLCAAVPATLAHPGHDHSSPVALLIHLAWITPFALAAYLFIRGSVSHKSPQEKKQ